jgi:hypothetical protein
MLDAVPDDGSGPVCFPRMRSGSADDFCARLRADYDVGVIQVAFLKCRIILGLASADQRKICVPASNGCRRRFRE